MTTPATLQPYLLHPDAVTRQVLEHVLAVLRSLLPFAAAAVMIAVLILAAVRVARNIQRYCMTRDARYIAILPPPECDPDGAEVLWTNLIALLRPWWLRLFVGQPHVTFEYSRSVRGLQIGMWVPNCVPRGMVERAITGAWPGSLTSTASPQPPVPLDWAVTGGTLRLARPEWFPLETRFGVDPMRPLIAATSDLADGESAAVQVLARPAASRRVHRLLHAADAVREGRSPYRRMWMPALRQGHLARAGTIDLIAAQDARLILGNVTAPQYEVLVRYAVGTQRSALDARRNIRGRAHGIASAFAVFTGRNYFRRRCLRRPAHVLKRRHLNHGDLLSVSELAAIAHLPTDRAVPGLVRAGARSVAPPPGVVSDGHVLGDAETGDRQPVALGVADARYHVHIIGATGSGKSTLLANLVLGDVTDGRGVVVIDPKGDLVTDILDRLPEAAAERLVLLDAEERVAPPTLNVLEGSDADLVVDNLVGIFRRIFENFWGPRTDDVLRAACLTLREGNQATLADVPQLLTDPVFRRQRLRSVKDPVLRGFWSWYDTMGEGQQAQLIGPLMNKLRAFLLRDFVYRVVGWSESSFEMADDVLDGGICLVRVPKGLLGEETARLLGSFVVASVWQAASRRARLGEDARVDATLYVDECQNFLTLPRAFDEMLAEARGFRLSMVLAHQYLGQLPVALREAISTNARSKLFFTVSPEDARALERHVVPQLSAHDLSHLGAYQAAARLVAGGSELPAFTLRTRPAPRRVDGRADEMRRSSRERFGREAPPTEARSRLTSERTRARTKPVRSGVRSGVRPTSLPVEQPSDAPSCS